MSKTYILQKDFGLIKAGEEIYWNSGYGKYYGRTYKHNHSECLSFTQEEIDRNPDWFELKENKSNDSFQWTDELAEEYAKWCMNKEHRGWGNLNSFKKLYQPKPQAENKPDWEIVAFKIGNVIRKKFSENCFEGGGTLNYHLNAKNNEIHSVKRLSDGEVFSVGDEVVWDLEQLPGNSPKPFTINSFQIDERWPGGKRMFCNNQNVSIKYLQKKLPPQPQKLFTTEDGVDIFEGDEYWFVSYTIKTLYHSSVAHKLAGSGSANDMFKYFSTKEAAEKYIADNKPKPQKEEQRIEVSDLTEEREYADPRCTDMHYSFNTSASITIEQAALIKKSIEQILNFTK